MQKSGKILRGRKDTLAPVVSTLRERAPPSPRHSDAFAFTCVECTHLYFPDGFFKWYGATIYFPATAIYIIYKFINLQSSSFLLSAVATTVLFSAEFFFVFCDQVTHKPLHLAWWNFARTYTSTTSRSLLNIKVKVTSVFCAFSVCMTLRLPADST